MQRSKAEIYLHFVWATARRKLLLVPEIERPIHRCIIEEAQKCGCIVLAIGGMPDHVHLFVKAPTTAAPAAIAQQVKGISSVFANKSLPLEERLRWQQHYAVFSVSRTHVPRAINYVRFQKRHHTSGKLWSVLEETEEEVPGDGLMPPGSAAGN